MSLHASTFEYHKPSDRQILTMAQARTAAADYALQLDELVPDGADKTYALRRLRELAMWVNVAITREADGTPRQD
jgi:hypothetical protein